ncbi:PEP/pyruvate-binding domain-containing protein [Succinivibrio sp.]|uniref:PEP/pyruvate-binding domain-containing protein n=1 Tax=Succinivibrio sp. TaxID=2053619 RepID=UPI0025E0C375|nr:PEP/pyruvate-binding domain-containing protein [Succinivibrio sp.]MBQ9219656.1 adenylyltransferase/cytidyltransferase family protein [Succinivibrio sp.]
MKISYSFGVMDLFHYGHLKALKQASDNADLHVVGLLSDNASKSWLGEIVSSEKERRAVIESLSCVNFVMDQKTLDPTDNLKKLHYIYPDATITLYRGDNITSASAREYLKSIGGEVKSINYYLKLSPSEILNILNRRVSFQKRHCDIISTKANTLLALQGLVKTATIEDILIVNVGELTDEPSTVVQRIQNKFTHKKIIVRSSSRGEDNFDTSNAGHYESILGINADNENELLEAMNTVKESYKKDGTPEPNEQILVQTQTDDIKYSGVIFTRDIQKNRPYYVINYDSSGLTDTVTGGEKAISTLWIASDINYSNIPPEWQSLFNTVKELENILSGMLLDIEFAVKKDNSVIIFQVRPLAASYKFGRDSNVKNYILSRKALKSQYLKYKHTDNLQLFSDMAFWNPAEIIGDNPKTLDYSLYRDVITSQAWNLGLIPLGYRKVTHDLMYRFGNKPYISLEYSFESLIPASLPKGMTYKLLDYYKNRFRNNTVLHDKIEFEIVFSCFDFETKDNLQQLVSNVFTEDELNLLENNLKDLTLNCIENYKNIYEEDIASLRKLENLRISTEKELDPASDHQFCQRRIAAVKVLLKGLNDFGTPQFARQARLAFIAKALLRTLEKKGYISSSVHDSFMSSISTVAGDFDEDIESYLHEKIPLDYLKKEYGHLRAGTYDICSPRYDHTDFFETLKSNRQPSSNFSDAEISELFTEEEVKALKTGIDKALQDNNINVAPELLIDFCKTSIAQREYFKFVFTRTLSSIIEIIASVGKRLKISRQDLSFYDITELLSLELYDSEERMAEFLNELLQLRKDKYLINSQLILPNVILGENDFDFICISTEKPNFITSHTVRGVVVSLDNNEKKQCKSSIEGKIVVIEKADPGYDWIFTCNILGLITKYGGVASHMAIRCAEFDIPAAIGCGASIYNYALNSKKLTLDCKKGTLKSCN